MGAPDWVDVFPIKNGDIPASYVSLPEGIVYMFGGWDSRSTLIAQKSPDP